MVGTFLARGMLVGIVAGLMAFAFARVAGEPQIDGAIAFEEQLEKAKEAAQAAPAEAPKPAAPTEAVKPAADGTQGMHAGHGMAAAPKETEETELVSRAVQGSIGLLTGVVIYSAAFGGLFALVFAFAYGRVGRLSPRATAALLAAAGFLTIVLVPTLKYPPNPPSVGNPDTLGYRTVLFLAMLVISIAA